jgi:DNA mismatch repair protein MSH4
MLYRSQLLPGTVAVSTGTSSSHVDVDNATARVLELVPTPGCRTSLLDLFKTKTKGGAQLLRSSLLQPPAVETTISGRLDALDEMLGSEALYQAVSAVLATCPPRLEQVVASFALAKKHTPGQAAQQVGASIAALLDLRAALALAPTLAAALAGASSSVLSSLHAVSTHPALAQLEAKIAALLDDEGPGMGRNSFAQRTNAVFALRTGSCGLLDVSRRKYCEITEAVNELVTQYNEGGAVTFRATFAPKRGFFLTAPTAEFDGVRGNRAHRDLSPSRADNLPACALSPQAPPAVKQLFNQSQRKGRQVHLATPELKALNVRLLDASNDCVMLSQNALDACAAMVRQQLSVITALVEGVALLDVLHCFAAMVAGSGRTFVRPTFSRDGPIAVQNGRHPMLDARTACVPNNAFLSSAASLVLVAGPNAAGKSTYLRQVALLALLAHAGCYVPAEFATFRVLDRICCVGMSECDDQLHNASTFMVECRELQHALATATRNSLVLIDELGRATSTGDAFALGLAACEHLVACNALCLCATHNERLLDTAMLMPGVKSAHLQVVPTNTMGTDTDLVFMHTLMEGAPLTACRHYGILTAQRLGMPPRLVAKAKAIVEVMERRIAAEAVSVEGLDEQLTLFSLAQRLMTLHMSADGLLLEDMCSSLRRLQEVAIQCAAKG